MALEATSESSAHPRLGLNQHEFGDPVAIVRDVQPGPGADLDDAPAGAAQERAPPEARARDLAQPENGSYTRERIRSHAADGGLAWSSVPDWMLAISVMPRTYERPHGARIARRGHLLQMAASAISHRSPRRAASTTVAVREVRPSLRRMFATWRGTVCGLSTSCPAISRSLRPRATQARGSHAHDWTAGPAPARLHGAAAAAPVPALRGTRGSRNRCHRARGSARCPAAG